MLTLKKIATAALLTTMPVIYSPATASTIDDQDAKYDSCYSACTGDNYSDGYCNTYCYKYAYGSESSGGGEPNVYTFDSPGGCSPQGVQPNNCVPV